MKAAILALLLSAPATSLVGSHAPVEAVRLNPTRIDFRVTPATVEIFLDGKRLGWANEVSKMTVRPGRRALRLKHGEDETEFELDVAKGTTVAFEYEFGD